MNNKIMKYLAEKSANAQSWIESNKNNIKNSGIKAIATILAVGGLVSMSGCKNNEPIQNQPTPSKPTITQSSTQADNDPNIVEITETQTNNEPSQDQEIVEKSESVARLYDSIATNMIRNQLLADGKITETDIIQGTFVDISPVKMSDNEYFPYFYTDFGYRPNYPWIESVEEGMAAYPTTLHATATINGIEQEKMFEFENFGVGMTGLMSIINSDDIKRPPMLLSYSHIKGTAIENHPLAEKCLGTFVNSSTTFTREDIVSANADQILAFELATEEIQSINFDGKLLYTDENEMN